MSNKIKRGRNSISIPLSLVIVPVDPNRSHMDQEKLEELTDSIREVGLIQPITVKQVGDHYEVVAGHRRTLACVAAGLVAIQAFVLTDSVDADVIKFHENVGREDLGVWDEANALQRALRTHPDWNQETLAVKLSKSPAYISQRLSCLNWPGVLVDLLKDETLPFSVCRELAGIKNTETLAYYARFAAQGGCTPALARQWRISANELPLSSSSDSEESTGVQRTPPPIAASFICQCCRNAFTDPRVISSLVVCDTCKATIIKAMSEPAV